MGSIPYLFLFFLLGTGLATAQDTFSIVAVDPATGEIGSAGATCLDVVQEGASAIIISDVLPGRGAIHTQSYWNAVNQANARVRMQAGDSPQVVINWLVANDAQNAPAFRQYGIVDFDPDGAPRSAAFTGAQCIDFKTHQTGTHYAIQGNILIGPEVLDAMEALFLQTQGSLADRLMAAMQGAKVPGADSRCLEEGVSSRSAFLRVARPEDDPDDLYLDLRVDATSFGVEPIDSLQHLFDAWLLTSDGSEAAEGLVRVFPNPTSSTLRVQLPFSGTCRATLYNAAGRRIWQQTVQGSQTITLPVNTGCYTLCIRDKDGKLVYAGQHVRIP